MALARLRHAPGAMDLVEFVSSRHANV